MKSLDEQDIDNDTRVIIVDMLHEERDGGFISSLFNGPLGNRVTRISPKPTVWQGKHRLTKDDWWAMSNARNTAICYCETQWIAFLDDRCVLMPGWLSAVKDAMRGGYAVCGTYEKVSNLVVLSGRVSTYDQQRNENGILTGVDSRDFHGQYPVRAPGQWFFGGSVAAPLEWMLNINGYDETCDGLSMEDVICGLMLENNNYPICYDPRMKILEDRTPGVGAHNMIRKDKGVSPNDKSHAMLNMLRGLRRSMHQWDLSEIRQTVLAGGAFPIPEGPKRDWYDGQLLSEM
jgi:hypothetical protein